MKTIKIIDLLNKIAKGEEVPKKIRIDHWCYNFEWVDYLENYYDKDAELNFMEVLSMSEEELNYGVEIIEDAKVAENKEIEKIVYIGYGEDGNMQYEIINKLNEVIDAVNKLNRK